MMNPPIPKIITVIAGTCLCGLILYGCGPSVYYGVGEMIGTNNCSVAVMDSLPPRRDAGTCDSLHCGEGAHQAVLAWTKDIDAAAERQTDGCFRDAMHGWAYYYRRWANEDFYESKKWDAAKKLGQSVIK